MALEGVAEARASLAEGDFELCLTAMRLPDGDGLEIVRYIAEQHAHMPVAVITAYGSTENAVAALKAGAFDYLAKPVGLEQLRALVRSALRVPDGESKDDPLQALIGDSADNIPGVSGIGPKTATKLLAQFGSLPECFAQADRIESDRVRGKLQAGRATAELNVQLMALDKHVPGVPEWSDVPAPAPDAAKLKAFFEKYELHRFAAEIEGKSAAAAPAAKPAMARPPSDQLSLF